MAEFKKLSAVEAVETVSETANVLIEENGVIKRAAKSEIGAQADWAETDENSPAFIKNKPENIGVQADWAETDEFSVSFIKNKPENIGGGGGYDAIIRYIEPWENPELVSGSYDDIVAKVKNGEWVNILIYGTMIPYNIYPTRVTEVTADWGESYYVRVTFEPLGFGDTSEKVCFIHQDGTVS